MVTTRFVCVSDTHGFSPKDGVFKLPKGDVLIHAGDLSNQGSSSELRKSLEWIEQADFEVKIIVGGNHDITLDREFYAQHGSRFHNQNPESAEECINLFTQTSSIIYLNHEPRTIRLTKPAGPQTSFKVFGSPYSPGDLEKWAFRYHRDTDEASNLWAQIPLDTDVVVTHTPPQEHCDYVKGHGNLGCEALRQALLRVRPRLAVCGHLHPARGYERMRWDTTTSDSGDGDGNGNENENENEAFEEGYCEPGSLPPLGSKKQSLVDLTGKKHRRLANDGSRLPALRPETKIEVSSSTEGLSAGVVPSQDDDDDRMAAASAGARGGSDPKSELNYEIPPGRNETCIVNASILANTWPYEGGRRFFSPIIVDLDLPQGGTDTQ